MTTIPKCPVHNYDFQVVGGIRPTLKKDADYERLFYCGCCDKYIMAYYKFYSQEEWVKK